jgi:hypothetical protein
VIRKGDDGATDPQNHGRMNLTMRVCVRVGLIWIVPGIDKILVQISTMISCMTKKKILVDLQVTKTLHDKKPIIPKELTPKRSLGINKSYRNCHGNHGRLLLFSVNVLNESLRHKIIPAILGCFLPYFASSQSVNKSNNILKI